MTFISYAVQELSEDLKIEDSVIAYAESQLGPQRNTRYGQYKSRVKLGLQTSPENFFYDETAFTGAPYVNLNALEFTMLAGLAEAAAYTTAPGTEMFSVVDGVLSGTPGSETVAAGAETAFLKLKVNEALIEQVEVREGDTYTICDAVGNPVSTTVQQIHLSLKSSNKPDFTFYEWHPQAKYRFNRDCNLITDAAAAAATAATNMAVAYMGDNNYVLSTDQFAATLAVVQGL
jgi:hypothetical protein